jgi:DNA (cytosine-5)-methyltransferase 1
MKLFGLQKLNTRNGQPRIWIETSRLNRLGFTPGTPLRIEIPPENNRLKLSTEFTLSNNQVSHRKTFGQNRPIIDITAQDKLAPLLDFEEINIRATFGQILINPSIRAFAIAKARRTTPPFRVLELFCGGGTLTEAIRQNPLFQITAGAEINPNFADAWENRHPEACLYLGNIHHLHPDDYPEFDILAAGIPCTDHSNMGRAKKKLAGRPETGEAGNLFLPVIELAAARMPAAIILENVPPFGNSLAGTCIQDRLKHLGYHVTTQILEPNEQWEEISNRRRWLLTATLKGEFKPVPPGIPCRKTAADFLDPANQEKDQAEANAIAKTIECLRNHNARHKALGHGFAMTVINGTETKIPTIPKSYHKINTGPFVATPFGERMLRKHEIEAIMGCKAPTENYALAVQILGQGVQTRIFKEIFRQLGEFLSQNQTHIRETLPPGQADNAHCAKQ